ncbi:hypothetical protein TcWFU_005949 [Taenia crassiceps]|uniref:Uncharacterized protein n=1 Tax=Taenia crassiceps TaxID=6207 RepID=A0ABR4QRS3_9CEST
MKRDRVMKTGLNQILCNNSAHQCACILMKWLRLPNPNKLQSVCWVALNYLSQIQLLAILGAYVVLIVAAC